MKVIFNVNDKLTFEIEADTQRNVFESLATIQEVFNETKCEKCKGEDLQYVVRNVNGDDYYELRCKNRDCRARLSYGVHKQGGTLFAKRKDKDNNWLNNSGWLRWNKETQQEE